MAGDPSKGADVFDTNCSACHSVASAMKNKMGPSLFGVVGRKAGTVEGYAYSTAMAADGRVWTAEALTAYLMNPKTSLPDNKMKFDSTSLTPVERNDLVAFLAAQK